MALVVYSRHARETDMARYTVTRVEADPTRWIVVRTPSWLARWFGAPVTETEVYLRRRVATTDFVVESDGKLLDQTPHGHEMATAIRHRPVMGAARTLALAIVQRHR